MEILLWLAGYSAVTGVAIVIFRLCRRLVRSSGKSLEREPAPPLNPRWACLHKKLIEVESAGEIVAYICESCDAQVDVTDQAAVDHRKVEAVAKAWTDLSGKLGEDRAIAQARLFAARTQLAERRAGSPYVPVLPNTEGFRTNWLSEDSPVIINERK